MVLQVLILFLAIQAKPPAIDELIRRLSAEELEVRGQAAADLLQSWSSVFGRFDG